MHELRYQVALAGSAMHLANVYRRHTILMHQRAPHEKNKPSIRLSTQMTSSGLVQFIRFIFMIHLCMQIHIFSLSVPLNGRNVSARTLTLVAYIMFWYSQFFFWFVFSRLLYLPRFDICVIFVMLSQLEPSSPLWPSQHWLAVFRTSCSRFS